MRSLSVNDPVFAFVEKESLPVSLSLVAVVPAIWETSVALFQNLILPKSKSAFVTSAPAPKFKNPALLLVLPEIDKLL